MRTTGHQTEMRRNRAYDDVLVEFGAGPGH